MFFDQGSRSHVFQNVLISSGVPERNAHVSFHRREMTSDQDIVLAEMLDDLFHRMLYVNHHEIGVRIDRHQHPSHGLN